MVSSYSGNPYSDSLPGLEQVSDPDEERRRLLQRNLAGMTETQFLTVDEARLLNLNLGALEDLDDINDWRIRVDIDEEDSTQRKFSFKDPSGYLYSATGVTDPDGTFYSSEEWDAALSEEVSYDDLPPMVEKDGVTYLNPSYQNIPAPGQVMPGTIEEYAAIATGMSPVVGADVSAYQGAIDNFYTATQQILDATEPGTGSANFGDAWGISRYGNYSVNTLAELATEGGQEQADLYPLLKSAADEAGVSVPELQAIIKRQYNLERIDMLNKANASGNLKLAHRLQQDLLTAPNLTMEERVSVIGGAEGLSAALKQYAPSLAPDKIEDVYTALAELRKIADNDTDAIVDWARSTGGGDMAKALLMAALPEVSLEGINTIFGAAESLDIQDKIIKTMKTMPEFAPSELNMDWVASHPADFVERLIDIGENEDTVALMQTLYPDIQKYKIKELLNSTTDDRGFFGKLWGSIAAGTGDLVASTGGGISWINSRFLNNGYSDAMGTALTQVGGIAQSQGVKSGGIGWDFTRMLPLMAALVIPAAGTYVALAGAGVRVGAAVASVTGSTRFSPFLAHLVQAFGAAAVSRPLESFMEAGGTYNEMIASGSYTEEEASAAASKVFKENMKLVGLDAAQFAVMFLPLSNIGGKVTKGLMTKGLIRKVGTGVGFALTMGSEGGEEYYQQIVQMQAKGEDIHLWAVAHNLSDEEIRQVTILGAMAGGIFEAPTMVMTIANTAMSNLPEPAYTEAHNNLADIIREGDLETQEEIDMAKIQALDSVMDYPEVQEIVTGAGQAVQVEWYRGEIRAETDADAANWDGILDSQRPEGIVYDESASVQTQRTASNILAEAENEPAIAYAQKLDKVERAKGIPNESNKAASLTKLENALLEIEGEQDIEGVQDVLDYIEEYRDIQRSGMTLEEYQEEKAQAWDNVMDALESLEVLKEQAEEEVIHTDTPVASAKSQALAMRIEELKQAIGLDKGEINEQAGRQYIRSIRDSYGDTLANQLQGEMNREVRIARERQAKIEAEVKRKQAIGKEYRTATAEEFVVARDNSKRSQFLSKYSAKELKEQGHTLRLSEDGKIGYMLSKEGEFMNLFNNSDERGAGVSAVIDAIVNGAKFGDCMDGFLPEYYAKFGFEETGRDTWDDQYAPEGWDYESYGRPDIVYIQYKGGTRDAVEIRRNYESACNRPVAGESVTGGTEEAGANGERSGSEEGRGVGEKQQGATTGTGKPTPRTRSVNKKSKPKAPRPKLVEEREGFKVDRFYDRSLRQYTVRIIDSTGDQVGVSQKAATKEDSIKLGQTMLADTIKAKADEETKAASKKAKTTKKKTTTKKKPTNPKGDVKETPVQTKPKTPKQPKKEATGGKPPKPPKEPPTALNEEPAPEEEPEGTMTYSEVNEHIGNIVQFWKEEASDVQAVKKRLTDFIRTNLPLAGKRVQGALLKMVEKVHDETTLERAMVRVQDYTEQYQQKTLKVEIKRQLKKSKPGKQGGFRHGKIHPDAHAVLARIAKHLQGDRNVARQQQAQNLEEVAKGNMTEDEALSENLFLGMVGIDKMTSGELAVMLEDIKNIKANGQFLLQEERAERKARHEYNRAVLLSEMRGTYTPGGESLPAGQLTKQRIKLMEYWEKFKNWNYGLYDLVAKMTAKTAQTGQSRTSKLIVDIIGKARNAESEGLRKIHATIRSEFQKIYGVKGTQDMNNALRAMDEVHVIGTFRNEGGSVVELKMTRNQAIKKYQEMTDPTLDPSFQKGLKWTTEMRTAVYNFVRSNPSDLAWADFQMRFYKEYYDTVNAVYRKLYGVDMAYNPFYSPIEREGLDDADKKALEDKPAHMVLFGDMQEFASVRSGHLKERVHSSKKLKFNGANDVFVNHINQMEHFKAWAEPISELRGIFNHSSVKVAIDQNFAGGMNHLLNNYIDLLARGGVRRSEVNRVADFLRRSAVIASLGLKPLIFLKQIPSFIAFMTTVDGVGMRDFMTGVTSFWSNPMENFNTLKEKSAWAAQRFAEGYERDVKFYMQKNANKTLSGKGNWRDVFVAHIRFGDKLAIGQGMWAKYQQGLKLREADVKAGRMTQEEADAQAIFDAETLARNTQPTSDIETMTALQNGGSWFKLMTMFQNQPNKYFRIVSNSLRDFKTGKGDRKVIAKNILIAGVILPCLFQLVSDAFRWRKENQARILLGHMQYTLISGQFFQSMWGWVAQGNDYDYEVSPVMQGFDDIKDTVIKGVDVINNGITMDDIIEFVEQAAKTGGQIAGFPTPYLIQVEKAIRANEAFVAPWNSELFFSQWALKHDRNKFDLMRELKDAQALIGTEKERKSEDSGLDYIPEYHTINEFKSTVANLLEKGEVMPEDVTEANGFSPLVIAMVQAMQYEKDYGQLPNTELYKLNADQTEDYTYTQLHDQWKAYQSITDPEVLEAWLKDYGDTYFLGNFSEQELALLDTYHGLNEEDQQAFLEEHPEIARNPAADYLYEDPEANAYMFLLGRGSLQTKEAYDILQGMMDDVDIPDRYLSNYDKIPPASVASAYFERQELLQSFTAGSSESLLFLLEHDKLRQWLGLQKPDNNINALRIKVNFRDDFERYYDITLSSERTAYLQENPDFAEAKIMLDGYNKGVPEEWIDTYVDYMQSGYIGNKRRRWLLRHYDFFLAMQEVLGWGELSEMGSTSADTGYGLPGLTYVS